MKKYLLIAVLWSVTHSSIAQLSKQQKSQIIDSISAVVNQYYVFPDVAIKMETQLHNQLQAKVYDTISNEVVFASVITNDLRSISKDKHLRLEFSASSLPPQNPDPMQMPEEEKEKYAQWLLSENYGIIKMDVLPGNIGYIDFKWFCGPEYAGDTYAAAMNYLSHTDALIIDLRHSHGAMSSEVIPFICSYFFEHSTHLNDLYWRIKNETIQTWTHAVVPRKKYLDKPIYILTSGKTFSGAEELAYDLKNLKRATIIGETTGGGANGGGDIRITEHFSLFVPMGRAINPVTKTNWEGTGVLPDTVIKSNRALYKAQIIALNKLIADCKNENWKQQLRQALANTEANEPKFKKIVFRLNGYANAKNVFVTGSFNNWSPESDKMQRKGNTWTAEVESEPGKITYKFIVDGLWITDPENKKTEKEGGYSNSVLLVAD